MRFRGSIIFAAAAMLFTGIAPVQGAPLPRVDLTPVQKAQPFEGVENVQYRRHRPPPRYGYYRGHRGYRDYRPGYRRHNGYWFPLAAFATGAIIGGAVSGQSAPRYGGSHHEWCANRWKSYRASDNTYQPYNGPRRECVSPYMR